MVDSKKYIIRVDEPWESAGLIIEGKVLKVLDIDCIVFKADKPVSISSVTGDLLVVFSRWVGGHFDKIEERKYWVIGGDILLTDLYDKLDKAGLKEKSKYVLIGEMRLI